MTRACVRRWRVHRFALARGASLPRDTRIHTTHDTQTHARTHSVRGHTTCEARYAMHSSGHSGVDCREGTQLGPCR